MKQTKNRQYVQRMHILPFLYTETHKGGWMMIGFIR